MLIEVPYGKDKMKAEIDEARVAGILEVNDVLVADETETVRKAIENPINSKNFRDFLADAKDVLFIVNDATRPTPTTRVLEIIYELIKPVNTKFIVATGAHRAPTEEEYQQIFGKYYEEFKSRIYVHDARSEKDLVYIGTSKSGTEMYVNRLGMEAHKIVIISSVEPHYFAGYTGGRKSILPGIAGYKSIEQNHKLCLNNTRAKTLALEGNPVHEDMVDSLGILRDKEIFSIMTVLDKNHRVYAATAGNLDDSFMAAADKANEVFAVKIKQKVDIVVTLPKFPMDIDLYQSLKAVENGKLALKEGGIMILVSKCRCGIGDETFVKLLSACDTPEETLKRIDEKFVLGYHKAAKLAETSLWAKTYSVTDLPDDILRSIFLTPFPSLQEALDNALSVKGKDAKVLFLLDGGMTVPMPA